MSPSVNWKNYKKKTQRNAVNHITIRCVKEGEIISDLHDTADGLLIDMKWKSSAEFLQAEQIQQAVILYKLGTSSQGRRQDGIWPAPPAPYGLQNTNGK